MKFTIEALSSSGSTVTHRVDAVDQDHANMLARKLMARRRVSIVACQPVASSDAACSHPASA